MSNVNAGVFNFPQILRRLGHRTKQVRDIVFVRDAIYSKSTKSTGATSDTEGSGSTLAGPAVNFGYETTGSTQVLAATTDTAYYVDSPEIVLPGIKTYQSPIVSRVGKLERTGHRITGACTFHIPPLSIIKSLDNFSDCKAFSEIETYDTFFDIERSIIKPTDTGEVTQQTTTFTMAANQPGYEVDRLQFKIKTAGVLDYVLLTGLQNNATATLKWDGNLTLSSSDFITVDLPISKVSDGDTTSIYKDGTRSEYTADTDTDADFDIDKMFGDSENKLQSVIVQLTASVAVEIKDIYLYKACEWSVENIKDYRDEYMAIGAVRVRGDRSSRRRAYG